MKLNSRKDVVIYFESKVLKEAIQRHNTRYPNYSIPRKSKDYYMQRVRGWFRRSDHVSDFLKLYNSRAFQAGFDRERFENSVDNGDSIDITHENLVERSVLLFHQSLARPKRKTGNKIQERDMRYAFSAQFFCGLLFFCD